jgi:hypothetical protein
MSERACEKLILKWLWFLPDMERKFELLVKVSSVLNMSRISFVFEVTDLGLSNLPS